MAYRRSILPSDREWLVIYIAKPVITRVASFLCPFYDEIKQWNQVRWYRNEVAFIYLNRGLIDKIDDDNIDLN